MSNQLVCKIDQLMSDIPLGHDISRIHEERDGQQGKCINPAHHTLYGKAHVHTREIHMQGRQTRDYHGHEYRYPKNQKPQKKHTADR